MKLKSYYRCGPQEVCAALIQRFPMALQIGYETLRARLRRLLNEHQIDRRTRKGWLLGTLRGLEHAAQSEENPALALVQLRGIHAGEGAQLG